MDNSFSRIAIRSLELDNSFSRITIRSLELDNPFSRVACRSLELHISIRENGLSNTRERIAIRENELSNSKERITNPWERIAQSISIYLWHFLKSPCPFRAFVSKNTLYQVWLKLGQWLKGNFISRQCIIPTWCFLQNWVEIGQGVREKNLFAIKKENLRIRHIFTHEHGPSLMPFPMFGWNWLSGSGVAFEVIYRRMWNA